nr:MAG TPA: hypothetical protein [Caudoviricetes sp.]
MQYGGGVKGSPSDFLGYIVNFKEDMQNGKHY